MGEGEALDADETLAGGGASVADEVVGSGAGGGEDGDGAGVLMEEGDGVLVEGGSGVGVDEGGLGGH